MKCTCGLVELNGAASVSRGDGVIHRPIAPCYHVEQRVTNAPTPETDDFCNGLRSNVLEVAQGAVDLANFARKLERERDEAREKYTMHVELKEWCGKCEMNWHPSLVESSVCIFCIQKETARERDQLRKVADELAKSLFAIHRETGCYSPCHAVIAIRLYNSLPHVIERNKTTP